MEIHVDRFMYFASSRRPEMAAKNITPDPFRKDEHDAVIKSSPEKSPGLIPNVRFAESAVPIEEKKETIPVQNMFITLTGSPGAGKSTQGKLLSARYGIPHISIGSLLRKEVSEGSTLGLMVAPYLKEGNLAPANIIGAVVKNRLSQPDCKNGFILDGYPRRMEDTEHFEETTKDLGIKNVQMVGIRTNPDLIVERLKYRRVCPDGHQYDLKNNPPKKPGICDHDGLKLKQREDDKPETIKHRFAVFHKETVPVINYYRDKGAYKEVSGNGGIDEVSGRLTEMLDPKDEKSENFAKQ